VRLSGVFESAMGAVVWWLGKTERRPNWTGAVAVMAYFEMNRTALIMLIVVVVVIGLFWLYVWLNRR
jgi:hypothetical protein